MAARLLKGRGAPPTSLPLLPAKLHPVRPKTVAWAVSRYLFVYDIERRAWEECRREIHTDTVRAMDAIVAPEPGETRWVSSGDDKQVIVWTEKGSAWTLSSKLSHPKKVTVVLFDAEGNVVFGDRFGEVYRWIPGEGSESQLLFSHLAIVTALTFAGCGKYLVSGDNYEKIRISHYPEAREIHSFCLGHMGQITALEPRGDAQLLSAAADGTLRLWNLDGEAYSACELGSPVISFCTNSDGIVAACEGCSSLCRVSIGDDTLTTKQVEGAEIPIELTGIQAVCSLPDGEILWIDRNGHLRNQHGGDFFDGADLPPAVVNLSKNANLWEEIGKDDAADEEGGQVAKKRKHAKGTAGRGPDDKPAEDCEMDV